ncbi:diacylglycerol kinase family protein [Candidatus Nomurabacteria bacterium]|uniref:Diacylglycerol kinase family protein n=1 Tax=candidate division WWE3 bacterium TaxID=2053526 RepID=A0A955E0U3_UNCKA|nr:diacylglycerol kinase family protein [candidate division WWE3 bacterium]MCB9824032.1 diacylglycerol kinase family protein [Candidatus Nomurabacteria bacterium]MCB9826997.1 diacylglycerol kinase family protein [Candidatus Nomurabacteria bacterium]MCB9827973.1 diacylglycerol kinase family protein [Candidatus Nomurabacteria bacterium]HXK52687.1 diacylglycerol kinase family protein [bacterium]
MKQTLKAHNPIKHAKSFKYAFNGIFHALLNEANFRVQIVITAIAVLLGIYYRISVEEWSILTLATGLLLSAEMFNTVLENIIDRLITDYDENAKIIKDLAAGFVLIMAVTCAILLGLIFGSRILVTVFN